LATLATQPVKIIDNIMPNRCERQGDIQDSTQKMKFKKHLAKPALINAKKPLKATTCKYLGSVHPEMPLFQE
jgi:hypothetical protein